MDPLEKFKKLKPKPRGKKRVELKLRINLWKVIIAFFLIIIFLPFILSVFQFQKLETKLILNYNDGASKVATKETNESYAELLEKAGIETTAVPYTVTDQSLM